MTKRLSIAAALLFATATILAAALTAGAHAPANGHFQQTWERTDKPVSDAAVVRTWMWGPEAFTDELHEPYLSSPGGERAVQYYDKSRMEITHPNGDPEAVWYVTNGLLVMEMMTGYLQTGDASGMQYAPAEINLAGDADDPTGPTYATFGAVRDEFALEAGAPVTFRIDRDGNLTNDLSLAAQGVTAAQYVEATGHQVASPFWAFMTSTGVVYADGAFQDAVLFENPYYATGLPVTEAYWASVQVAGEQTDVLIQCFERRCLTYNPANAPEWQVEAGNVGRHYYHWRYEVIGAGNSPDPTATDESETPTATATEETALTPTAGMTEEPEPTPPATATIPNSGQVKDAVEAAAGEIVACLSTVVTPEALLDLAAGEPDKVANAINACLSNSLPSAVSDALEPLVDRAVVCAADTMDALTVEQISTLVNGTADEQQELVEEIATDTIDCLISGL